MKKAVFWDEVENEGIPIGKNHLFVIGIDSYTNGIRPLDNCVRDTQRFVQVLQENYAFADVLCLYNEAATLENVIEQLAHYTARLTESDNLIICFSGHGYLKDGIGYLVPADAKNGKVYGLLNNEQIKSYIKNCKAKHVLLIVDSCYSGSFLLKDKDIAELKGFSKEVIKYRSRWVLAAGRIEKVSDGEYGKHSPFATTVISYLEANTDRIFSISDLAQYVKNTTPTLANQVPIAGVLKDAEDLGGEFIFIPQNNEKEAFEQAKTRIEIEKFIANYPNGKYLAEAEKLRLQFLQSEANQLYEQILAAPIPEKSKWIDAYKRSYKGIDDTQYQAVLVEGKKADDYKVWQRINKHSENNLELFLLQQSDNFFVADAQMLLNELIAKRKEEEERALAAEAKRLQEIEDEKARKAAEAKRLQAIEEEKERKAAEAKRLQEIEDEKQRKAAETKRLQEIEEKKERKAAEAKRLQEIEEEKERKAAEAKRLQEIEEEKERKAAEAKHLQEIEEEKQRKAAEAKRLQEIEDEKERKAAEAKRLQEIEQEKARKAAEAKRLQEIEKKKESNPSPYANSNTISAQANYSPYLKGVGIAMLLLLCILGVVKLTNRGANRQKIAEQQRIKDSIRQVEVEDSLKKAVYIAQKREKAIADSIAKVQQSAKTSASTTSSPKTTTTKSTITTPKPPKTLKTTVATKYVATTSPVTTKSTLSYEIRNKIAALRKEADVLQYDGELELAKKKRDQAYRLENGN